MHSYECLKAREGSMVIGRPPVVIAGVIVAVATLVVEKKYA